MDIGQLTRIFCDVDDFCKEFQQHTEHAFLLGCETTKKGPAAYLQDSEIMTILIAFQFIGYRNFKTFYTSYVAQFWKSAFPKLPSYNRFVEIMRRVTLLLTLFSQLRTGKRSGIYYIDSTCLPVCHLKRSSRHKTFDAIAEYGRTSIGWFFGLKLHIVINHVGELIAFKITRGNVNDSKASESLLSVLKGIACGDKGYIGKKLFDTLIQKGLKLITRTRKNMKPKLYTKQEQQLLNQRGIIETVINHFKHHYHVWHTRHRSIINAMTHLVAAIAAYVIEPLKISAIKLLAGPERLLPQKCS
jgi:hypothetical protein